MSGVFRYPYSLHELNYSNSDEKSILAVFTNIQEYLENYLDNTPKIKSMVKLRFSCDLNWLWPDIRPQIILHIHGLQNWFYSKSII